MATSGRAGEREEGNSTRRTAIIVAGMHRSGTSAVARMLMLLGADVPRHPMPAREGNEAGHWEPLPIVEFHDELLSSVSMGWDDVGAFPAEWLEGPSGSAFRRRAGELIASEFGASALFALKDPRICRIIPFWSSVLHDAGIDPVFVLTQRNPLEVAASLKRRDGIPTSRGLLLWLRHVLDAEAATRAQPRAFVSYEAVLRDWEAVSRAISDRLGIKWRGPSHGTKQEIERFISVEGRHHEFAAQELEARPEIVDWVKRAYSVLADAAAANQDPAADVLDEVRSLLDDADTAYGPILAEAENERGTLAEEATRLTEQLRSREEALDERSSELERLAAEFGARQAESEEARRQLAKQSASLAEELRGRDDALAQRTGELERIAAELADRQAETEQARRQLAEAQNERGTLAEEATRLAEQLRGRDDALAQRTGELERIAAELVDRQAETEQARRQLAEAQNERGTLAEEATRLTEQLRSREEALAHRTGELEQLAAALDAAQDERQQAVAGLAEEIRRMSAELAALRQGRIKRIARRLGRSRRSTSQLLSWVFVRPSRQRLRYLSTYLALRRSGEFDADFYRSANPDVASTFQNPLMHYVEHGGVEGRDPNRVFSTKGYLACHPEVTSTGANPLLDWLRSGKKPFSSPRVNVSGDPGNEASPQRSSRRRAARTPKGYRDFVTGAIPAGGIAVVASDGESALLTLPGLKTRKFPQGRENGAAASTGSTVALAQLEWLRAHGAEYLVLPQQTREWWGSLQEFYSYVGRHYPWAAISEQGSIARLDSGLNGAQSWQTRLEGRLQEHRARFRDLPSILDLTHGLDVAASFPELTVIEPVQDAGLLPYVEDSVDLVIVGERATVDQLAEGRRIARNAVIRIGTGADDREAIEWLSQPERRLPTISILVPSYDGADHLEICLRTLSDSVPAHLQAEVLVIDDCSSDPTPELLSTWSERDQRIRHLRSDRNWGFVDSCNLGAAKAEGELLVFLNNDTIPVNGWLQPLVETLADREDAGAVGGMLLYPNGTLQEAGGVIFSDGSGANFGKGDSPDHPLYRFVRTVDYCSGALLATERRTFEELGGFDTSYRPGYYEDVDYCFRLRRAGLNTYYQPKSMVIHIEGGTAGVDLSEGPKRYQVVNGERFRERWAEDLSAQPPPPDSFDQAVWARLARRPRPVGSIG